MLGGFLMNYPQGTRRQATANNHSNKPIVNFANRGMTLETEINETNDYYLFTNKAIVHKKPTPIQVVNVHYPKRSAAKITEAYFQEKATTDYNGIYKGKHLDFEAKETKNKTTFPLNNIHRHQIDHMRSVSAHGGICFMIIRFIAHDKTYFILSDKIITYWDMMFNGGKKSIPYETIKCEGHEIPFTYQAKVDYLSIIDQFYLTK